MQLLGYYIHQLSPFILQINENLGFRWYGFAYVMAFAVGYWLYRNLAQRGYGPLAPERVGDFIALGAIFGVMIGGRLGWILFYGWNRVSHDPMEALRIWDGGMSSHGGILGLAIFSFVYARWQHLSWLGIGDNLVVVSPIGLFFGRVANFINGELWGRVITKQPAPAWAMQFPKELEGRAPELVERAYAHDPEALQTLSQILPLRYPSQLIEAGLEGVVLFAILWVLRTRFRTPAGVLIGVFFIAYSILRIIGEQFREPDIGVALTWGFTRGQFLSLFLILIGILFLGAAFRHPVYFLPKDRMPGGK